MRLVHNIVVSVNDIEANQLDVHSPTTASSSEPEARQQNESEPDLQPDAHSEIEYEPQSDSQPVPQPVPRAQAEIQSEPWDQVHYVPRYVPVYVPDLRYYDSAANKAANVSAKRSSWPIVMAVCPRFDFNIARACLDATQEGVRIRADAHLKEAFGRKKASENDASSVDADDHDQIFQSLQKRTLACQVLERQCRQIRDERDRLVIAFMASSKPNQ